MATATNEIEEIRRQMAQIRRELHEDVQEVVAGAEAVGGASGLDGGAPPPKAVLSTSDLVMRPAGPLPGTFARSTPSTAAAASSPSITEPLA